VSGIHQAACLGDLNRVNASLQEDINIDVKDELGWAPLHWAVLMGQKEACQMLVSKGARIEAENNDGYTPLNIVAYGGNLEGAELLITNGANVNTRAKNGFTPLHSAAHQGHKKIVELLLAHGADKYLKNSRGRTALTVAINRGHTEIVELLRKHGEKDMSYAALSMGGANLNKSLHQAAADGNVKQIKQHISNGADVNAIGGEKDWPPLMYAASKGHAEAVKVLISSGARVDISVRGLTTLIHSILNNDNKDVVKALIAGGADVNQRSGPRLAAAPALTFAVWRHREAIVKVLLEVGADVDAKDKWGYTPLHYAAFPFNGDKVELMLILNKRDYPETVFIAACKGDLQKVRTLLADGDVNMKDKFGCTLLHWAALADSPQVADFLITGGADVNARGGAFNLTPLLSAHALSVVELLVSKGADIDATGTDIYKIYNESGRTKLYLACSLGDMDMAEFLFSQGASVNVKGARDRTPLMQAAARGHLQVVKFLISKGADINARDNEGQTALSLAKKQEHDEIAALLSKHGAR
jgi:ankyrin repeat protein